jgi:hypothetical protein
MDYVRGQHSMDNAYQLRGKHGASAVAAGQKCGLQLPHLHEGRAGLRSHRRSDACETAASRAPRLLLQLRRGASRM